MMNEPETLLSLLIHEYLKISEIALVKMSITMDLMNGEPEDYSAEWQHLRESAVIRSEEIARFADSDTSQDRPCYKLLKETHARERDMLGQIFSPRTALGFPEADVAAIRELVEAHRKNINEIALLINARYAMDRRWRRALLKAITAEDIMQAVKKADPNWIVRMFAKKGRKHEKK